MNKENNCGNCAWFAPMGCQGKAEPCDKWKAIPKPAEVKAKGWEQRFDTFWKSYADKEDVLYTWNNCQRRKDELLSFIRAEIERVREEEKQATLKYLVKVDIENCLSTDCDNISCKECAAKQIEQNKHREKK